MRAGSRIPERMTPTPAALEGITVLDLSTVGPATRCARILADYGARVIKVGVPPRKLGLQTQPAFWSYSAQRGMEQARIDLKDAAERGEGDPAGWMAFFSQARAVSALCFALGPNPDDAARDVICEALHALESRREAVERIRAELEG